MQIGSNQFTLNKTYTDGFKNVRNVDFEVYEPQNLDANNPPVVNGVQVTSDKAVVKSKDGLQVVEKAKLDLVTKDKKMELSQVVPTSKF